VALERWYPHLVIAALVAPLGFLLIAASLDSELGLGVFSIEVGELQQHMTKVAQRPTIEMALGVSLIVMSLGLALRSSLAWIWTVAVMGVSLALRVPPESSDLPFAVYFGVVLALLLVHRRRFATQSILSSTVFAVVVLTTFFAWAVLGTLRLGGQFDPPVQDLETAVYLTVVTVSSVGFGDIVAKGREARLFVAAEIALGLVVVATAFSAILLPLIGVRMREILGGKKHVERSNHFVIVGHSPLARNAAQELEKRGQRITIILGNALEEDFYQHRDVVVGDATDLATLRAAGADEARAVLTLSTDDATNGFVILGVNELDPTITTVAALNDPANQFRLKRTQPSMLLSLQSLGGELLAMALTGERVEVDMLTRVLQVHGEEGKVAGE
jgi:voltage-gated potassium channel